MGESKCEGTHEEARTEEAILGQQEKESERKNKQKQNHNTDLLENWSKSSIQANIYAHTQSQLVILETASL